jgi:hypothetical protein
VCRSRDFLSKVDAMPACSDIAAINWKSVHHYRPVALEAVRELWNARPMNIALQELVMKNPRIRFDEVRSEGKLLVSMLRGWEMIKQTE